MNRLLRLMAAMIGLSVFGLAYAAPEMVRIPGKNYEIGKYEVTQKEWQDIMGNNPSKFSGCGENCPVEQVSWNDIQEFLQKLNAKTGKNYRLPTMEEWFFACNGGSQSEYCGGNDLDSVGWYNSNSGNTTHPVGQKQANGYGLYDMSGNVFELTSSCHYENCKYEYREMRGGSWLNVSPQIRATYIGTRDPEERNYFVGFRLARTLTPDDDKPAAAKPAQAAPSGAASSNASGSGAKTGKSGSEASSNKSGSGNNAATSGGLKLQMQEKQPEGAAPAPKPAAKPAEPAKKAPEAAKEEVKMVTTSGERMQVESRKTADEACKAANARLDQWAGDSSDGMGGTIKRKVSFRETCVCNPVKDVAPPHEVYAHSCSVTYKWQETRRELSKGASVGGAKAQ